LKDKLVSPGLLGLAAAAAPFVLAVRVWWIHTYVDPRPELDFLAIPFVYFLIFLGLGITFFGARSIIGTEYRVNGGMVFAGSLLSGIFVIPGIFQVPTLTDGLVLGGVILSSSLGVAGGLKGIYWEKSWKEGAAIPQLAEYSRWAIIGGSVLLYVTPWFYLEPLTVVGSIVAPVSGALVYKGKGNRRLLGFAIILGMLLAGSPFWLGDPSYGLVWNLTNRLNRGVTTLGVLGLACTVLSVVAGLKILTWRTTAPAAARGGELSRAPSGIAPQRVDLWRG
jgi:hypothetical protein